MLINHFRTSLNAKQDDDLLLLNQSFLACRTIFLVNLIKFNHAAKAFILNS